MRRTLTIITLCLLAGPQVDAGDGGHWAFDRLDATPPVVRDRSWPAGRIDEFVLAGLEARDLAPAPPASRRTLIRRLSLDFLGLPPTPDEVEAFLADTAPDAVSRLVDRLLASPRHGERWGRHWLDVARYGDSNGGDENLAFPNAWRYRDWVIRSFNADRPFDELVVEQIAGDLARASRDAVDPEAIIATGFLSLGTKILAEPDPLKMEMDIIDEQLDTVGRAFLGLSIGCARCHDHKFDPISQRDYYALAGVFKSTRTMQSFQKVARWQERPVPSPELAATLREIEGSLQDRRERVDAIVAAENDRLRRTWLRDSEKYHAGGRELVAWRRLFGGGSPLGPSLEKGEHASRALLIEAERFQRGNVIVDRENYGAGIGIISDPGSQKNWAEYDVELEADGVYQVELRYAARNARPGRLLVDGAVAAPRAIEHATGGWFPPHQRWFVETVIRLAAGAHVVRVESEPMMSHIDKLLLVRVEPPREDPGGRVPRSAAQIAAAEDLDAPVLEQWADFLETAGEPPAGATLLEWAQSAPDDRSPLRVPEGIEASYSEAARADLGALRAEIERLEKSRPPTPTAMAVSDGDPGDAPLLARGDPLSPEAMVPRGVPASFGELTGAAAEPVAEDASGRLELARWLVDRRNRLTARVMANRVWGWHLGDPLVRTTENFGVTGERPVHGTLLDWLARRLVESGWSLKRLHREIVLSSTYGMSSARHERGVELDPANRLLWRFRPRRLDAEAIRDAVIALAGDLDLRIGGPPTAVKAQDPTSADLARNDEAYLADRRRSVYLPIVRTQVFDLLTTFDFCDPGVSTGSRIRTTVPQQALFLMNSPLVLEWSRRIADRLASGGGDDATRVQRLWMRAYGRPAADVEVADALEYLEKQRAIRAQGETSDAPGRAPGLEPWQGLCQAVIASSELGYVR